MSLHIDACCLCDLRYRDYTNKCVISLYVNLFFHLSVFYSLFLSLCVFDDIQVLYAALCQWFSGLIPFGMVI